MKKIDISQVDTSKLNNIIFNKEIPKLKTETITIKNKIKLEYNEEENSLDFIVQE